MAITSEMLRKLEENYKRDLADQKEPLIRIIKSNNPEWPVKHNDQTFESSRL
jgi:hypothetical protein